MLVTGGGRVRVILTAAACAAAALVLVAAGASDGFAQANPFGAPRAPAAPALPAPPDGLIGWIIAKQNEFYRQFSGLIRAAKSDGTAVWTLLGVSFLYGVFHAAGPGHGKAVISSYVLANEETWRRGVILSFASAMVQAFVAVAIVGIAAALFQASRAAICNTEYYVEIVSYALIALIGARLTWVKGRGFVAAVTAPPDKAEHLHRRGHFHSHSHKHAHNHSHSHTPDHGHGHAHRHDDHGHVHDEHCGHSHGPEPHQLAGPGGWRRGLSAIFAVGLRPCSGAILVLVFALAQGLFWAGVVSTFVMGLGTAITVAAIATLAVSAKEIAVRLAGRDSGRATLTLRGIEVAAALAVLAFGVALLAGYMAAERIAVAC